MSFHVTYKVRGGIRVLNTDDAFDLNCAVCRIPSVIIGELDQRIMGCSLLPSPTSAKSHHDGEKFQQEFRI